MVSAVTAGIVLSSLVENATTLPQRVRVKRIPAAVETGRVTDPRRQVPRTDAVLADVRLVDATGRLGPELVKAAVRSAQEQVRRGALAPTAVADAAVSLLPQRATSLRPVLNCTGVVLHTNLGRAPLSPGAIEAM